MPTGWQSLWTSGVALMQLNSLTAVGASCSPVSRASAVTSICHVRHRTRSCTFGHNTGRPPSTRHVEASCTARPLSAVLASRGSTRPAMSAHVGGLERGAQRARGIPWRARDAPCKRSTRAWVGVDWAWAWAWRVPRAACTADPHLRSRKLASSSLSSCSMDPSCCSLMAFAGSRPLPAAASWRSSSRSRLRRAGAPPWRMS